MASVAGRKKSIVSTNGTLVANNTLLNKAASQSTSLYQQCSSLRASLLRIHNFAPYFALSSHSSDSRHSTDPVTQLWDCFSLGIPLCYIFNLLPPPVTPINIDTDPTSFDIDNERAKKHAIALFAMQLKQIEQCEAFTVTDLWDRHSTDGLVKVINTVSILVDKLPEDMFEASPPSPITLVSSHDSLESLASDPTLVSAPTGGKEGARNNIVREMVETERKYVQDLEVMQKYSNALSQSNIIDQDTIHLLFPNLNKLLNFQRKFLIRLESTAELPWKDQRWGLHFIENEDEFTVYEPYCANYTNATELMLAEEQNLISHNHLINAKSELPAFLIKPVQRICKYPLLLDSLIKASSPNDYPHFDELKAGSAAAKRITDKINEAQRRAENLQTVKNLEGRIEDWKGHHLSHFGDLLLDDIFVVTKSEVDREYHVFLFEKIILCCKEAFLPTGSSRKVGKSNSLLKKQASPSPLSLPGGVGQPKRKNTPLLLKGRIFLNNVTQAVPATPNQRLSTSTMSNQYALAVWWRGDDDLEFFTLRCRTEDQLKQWEGQINKLIKAAASRRASERGATRIATQIANSTNPAQARHSPYYYTREKSSFSTSQSVYLSALPPRPNSTTGRQPRVSPYSSDDQGSIPNGGFNGGPQGYPPHDGFDFEQDDEFEDYPPTASYSTSGRGTPMGMRRGTSASMPFERDSVPGYDRPRAQTEEPNGPVMAQWRSNGVTIPPPPPSIPNGFTTAPLRPITPRQTSNASGSSFASNNSDASFGPGIRTRPPLRSQFSSTKLKSVYDSEDSRSGTPLMLNPPPLNRSRSASQPQAYVQKTVPPPLPSVSHWTNRATPVESKRGSGSSQSTGDSSDYSPNSSSPITPSYGSSESSLGGGGGLRPSRSQHFDNATHSVGSHMHFSPPVKVKVHFHEDIFVIQVPRSMEYDDLVERVGKKIRLCGPRRDDGPLRVKYKDEDGDMVSLGSTEDVQMAFEQYRPGGQVTLFVQ